MFALTLSLLASMISVGYAASLPVVEQADINFPFVDTSPAQNLTWEEVSVPRPGANPATYSITCSGSYGVGLEARSCFNALSYTPRSDHQETWVNDGVVPPGIQGAVRLPILILSNDTTCYINPHLILTANVGHASALNVSEAARAIIKGCVIPRRTGGQARNIGGDNKLSVDVRGIRSWHVQCGAPISATPRSCGYILNEMRKNTVEEIFGRPGSGRMTIALPLTLRSPDGLCQIVVDTIPGAAVCVYTTWGKVWAAAEVIAAACVRAGKGGLAPVAGTSAPPIRRPNINLRVTIMDEPAQLVLPGGHVLDTTEKRTPSAERE